MTKGWAVSAIASVMLISLAPAQHSQSAPPLGSVGRWQLQAVTVDEQTGSHGPFLPAHEVFLLDSETGRLWKFQPNTILNDGSAVPEMLLPVEPAIVKH